MNITLKTNPTEPVDGIVVLAYGPQPMDFFSKVSKVCGKGAVMDPDVARMAGANLAAGLPEALANVRKRLEAGALEAIQDANPGALHAVCQWLAHGERGMSSEALFSRLSGIDTCSGGRTKAHPLDPADFRRCRLMLEAIPSLKDKLSEARDISPEWEKLIDAWPRLCSIMDAECPTWREGRGQKARALYDEMKVVLGEKFKRSLPKTETMKISHIKINSILGIKELEFSPEGYTEITGQNGKGKTSVLEAIKGAVSGSHDATLLRKGSEKGEIVLVLDDGTEIKKRITSSRSTTDVTDPDGKKIPSPAAALKGLTDLLSVNPVEFLTARKQDRVKVLLESMPLELDAAKLEELAGIPVKASPGVHALAVIDMVRKEVYDIRTGTNRAVKEKDATINQLRLAMPEAPGGVEGDEAEMQGQIDAARTTRDAELARITAKIDGIRIDHQTKLDTLKNEAQAKIDAIKAELETASEGVRQSLAGIEAKANTQRDLTKNRFTDATTPIQAALTGVRTNRDAVAKREQTKATITQMEADLEELQSDAEKQTAAIEAIDNYKIELLDNLPIPGVEVIDGEVFRGGIPFDRLNTAQQVGIAVEIAKLRAGELAVCCLDGFELLDPAALEEFKARAEDANIQFFVTRVTGEEFAIRTE